MLNHVIVAGNLGKDPEIREVNGATSARMLLATSEYYKDKNGERRKETQWHNLVAWGLPAELARDRLAKGSRILAEGKITYRDWQDKDGNRHTNAEIRVKRLLILDARRPEEAGNDIPF